ncbi:MAG: leucine-rich repeat domain-containing protein [Anaerolineales bacterium]|nr:leucine-rich repeat domain-containing protein [Anaerolineales bacterium]
MIPEEASRRIEEAKRTGADELDLRGLGLHELPPAERQLTQLRHLKLGHHSRSYYYLVTYNFLTALPDWLGNLTQLQSLDLSYNNLTALPDWLGNLTQLQSLDLSGNNLTALPQWLSAFKQLRQLDLQENPLSIPAELLRQTYNPQLILQTYFAARGRPLHEAKVLLVGQGAVGKTSLLRRLTDESFDPQEPTTHGINVAHRPITLPGSPSVTVQLNLWDFGGQEIMHNTHRFFLTQRSLYLVVLNAREDERANRLHYWLNLIGDIAPDAPIIIVGNKIDQSPAFNLNERELRYRYPAIVGFVYTNCEEYTCKRHIEAELEDRFGPLEQLIAAALAEKLPQIHDRLPSGWFDLKQEMEDMKAHTIPFATYQQACQRHGLEGEELQRGYLRVLHELGTILNYPDDPRLADFGIMNRNWVVQGVYAIITSEQLANARGKLHLRDLPVIYDDCQEVVTKDYPLSTHALIISMMEKFELCYPFDSAGNFLVPDLLAKEAATSVDFAALTSRSLAFRYEYEALPPSILSRFIVRRHSSIQTVWRTGVVLRRGEQIAFVRSRADGIPPTIAIDITGPGDRRPLLEIIRSTFEEIHAPTMTVREMVPLPDHPTVALPYNNLRKMIERGIERQYVAEVDDFIVPSDLLGVIEEPNRRRTQPEEPPRSQLEPAPAAQEPTLPSEKPAKPGRLEKVGHAAQSIGDQFDSIKNLIAGSVIILVIILFIINAFVEIPFMQQLIEWLKTQWAGLWG